jgi:bacterial/archaeal transporter family protein
VNGNDVTKGRALMAGWIIPALGYVVLVGIAGITTKVALRTIEWQQIVYWVPVVYAFLSVILYLVYHKPMVLGAGGGWAIVTAFAAAGGLICFFYALSKGDASVVVPTTSAYPVVALAGGAIFLSESITVTRLIGTALVIAGVVVISS